MDFVVRYWDNVNNEVSVCYLNSKFLVHAAAYIICKFNEGIKELNKGQLLQISMDGPSVNWTFLKEIQKHHEEAELPQLINIGSCGLHIIHGAFQTGATTTCWNIKGTLKAIYKLLHDSPVCHADYISVSGSMIFPFLFCATGLVEDKKVADMAIEIWLINVKLLAYGKN